VIDDDDDDEGELGVETGFSVCDVFERKGIKGHEGDSKVLGVKYRR